MRNDKLIKKLFSGLPYALRKNTSQERNSKLVNLGSKLALRFEQWRSDTIYKNNILELCFVWYVQRISPEYKGKKDIKKKITYFPSSSVKAGAVPAFLASSNSFSFRQSSRLLCCNSVLAAILLFPSHNTVPWTTFTSLPFYNSTQGGDS